MGASSSRDDGSADPARSTALEGMRPRFRRDALFAESDDGVYLQRPGDEFVLKGRSVYRWMASLVPLMNGAHTVAQLADGLSDSHRKTLLNLITVLTERGYVHTDEPDVAARSSGQVRERFSRQIEYVAHFASGRDASFDAFRESRFLVLGADELVSAVGAGLLHNGAEHVDIGRPSVAAVKDLSAEADRLRASGCACTVRERPWQEHGALDEYDVVVAAAGDVRELRRLNELAHAGGPALLPLLILGDRAVAGPLVRAGAGPCWQCALLRQSSARPAEQSVQLWRAAALGGGCDADRCPPQLARMLGTMLAFEAFRLRTGVLPAETEGALVVQNLDTAESERTRLLAHPLCPVCSHDVGDPAAPADDALFGADGGILGGYHDAELTQSPLRVGRVVLPSVDGPYDARREITAFDLDTVDNARRRAVRLAATCYAEQLAGRPDSVTGTPSGEDSGTIPAGTLAIHSGLSASTGSWVPGRSLVDGRACWVPAAAAYPQSPRNDGAAFEATSAGAVCADSIAEAEQAGLLSALGFAGLCAALRGERPAEQIEADGETDDLDFLLRIARQLDEPFRILDLPGCSPGFGCVVTAGESPVWALGTGYRRAEAAASALRDVLGLLGLRAPGNGVDIGNPVLSGLDAGRLPVTDPGPPRAPTSHQEIVARLRERRQDAYVVDTTPRDLRDAGLVTARVLLGGREC